MEEREWTEKLQDQQQRKNKQVTVEEALRKIHNCFCKPQEAPENLKALLQECHSNKR